MWLTIRLSRANVWNQVEQAKRRFGDCMRIPLGRSVAAAITPGGGDGDHACSASGLDVAHVVANIPACRWRNAQALRRFEQRGRVGLGMRRGVARYDAACVAQADQRNQWVGETHRLVGDDAPAYPCGLQAVEQVRNAVEQAAVDGNRRCIVIEESNAQRFVFLGVGSQVQARAYQAARAGRCIRPQAFVGRRRQAAVGPQPVQGCCQIRSGIGERAVEVKQDSFADARKKRSLSWLPDQLAGRLAATR